MEYLEEAKKFAKQVRSSYIGTEHLVYAILDSEPQTSKLLEISADNYKDRLVQAVGIPPLDKEGYAKEMTPKLRAILRYLKLEIKKEDALHFLETIYNNGEGVGYKLLDELGANFEGYFDFMHKNDIPEDLLQNDYLVNLNEKVENNHIHIYGLKSKCDELIDNLFRIRKPNIIITGKAGCGKSALVELLAERINSGDVPEFMKNKVIFEMIVPNAVAGTRYRGDFEERIKSVLNEVQKCPRVILFIDEFHTVMTAGGAEGAVALANILKPYLARGEISLIGATTTEEYEIIKKDKAMQRRFTRILMDSPDEEEIFNILKGWAPQLEDHYHVSIDDNLLRNTIKHCRRNRENSSPDKELDELEKWCLEHCNWRAINWKELTKSV